MSNFLAPDDLRSLAKVADCLSIMDGGLTLEVKVFDENGEVVGFLRYEPSWGSYVFVTTLED